MKYKTVKTGNQPHKPTSPEQREAARKYGQAHGFKGAEGGWIYDEQGYHIAHGWGQFWHLYKRSIVAEGYIPKETAGSR